MSTIECRECRGVPDETEPCWACHGTGQVPECDCDRIHGWACPVYGLDAQPEIPPVPSHYVPAPECRACGGVRDRHTYCETCGGLPGTRNHVQWVDPATLSPTRNTAVESTPCVEQVATQEADHGE